MKLFFNTGIHEAQIVMQLDLEEKDEKKIASKIMQRKSVISLQHYIAAGANDNSAVIIWNGNIPVKKIIGKWEFDHTVKKSNFYSNYLRFTPLCDVKSFALETVDEDTDEYYLYYTYNFYTRL